jgi:hypothetical protein
LIATTLKKGRPAQHLEGVIMSAYHRFLVPSSLVLLGFGLGLGLGIAQFAGVAEAQSSGRVFELRTYTAHPGRVEALHARFAEHTMELFERHGIENIGYFSPQDSPLAESTLIYILAHDSRAAAEASWAAFRADPDWQRVSEETQRDGRIVENVDKVFLDATNYSPLK